MRVRVRASECLCCGQLAVSFVFRFKSFRCCCRVLFELILNAHWNTAINLGNVGQKLMENELLVHRRFPAANHFLCSPEITAF